MKKETIIAIFLGILAGVSIAGFVIFHSKRSETSSSDVILDNITPTAAINTDELSPLLITSPEDDAVVETQTVDLKGTAQVGSLLVIQTVSGEDAFMVEESSFTHEINLIPGENMIRITSYNDKNIDSRSLTIYFIEK